MPADRLDQFGPYLMTRAAKAVRRIPRARRKSFLKSTIGHSTATPARGIQRAEFS